MDDLLALNERVADLERRVTKLEPPAVVVEPVPPVVEPPATSLQLFEHTDFGGRSIMNAGAVPNYQSIGFNDRASSAIAIGTWEAFEHAGYKGEKLIIPNGRHPQLSMNDRISSARPVMGNPIAPEPSPLDEPRTPNPTAALRRRQRLAQIDLAFFYADLTQFAETKGWVTDSHIPTMMEFAKYGVNSYGFQLMRAAVAAGEKRLIVSLGEFGFTALGKLRLYRGRGVVRDDLRLWFATAQNADLLRYVSGIYTADEPNKPDERISEPDLEAFCDDCRFVAAEFQMPNLPLWIIYGAQNGDRPGWRKHHRIGIDDYGRGLAVFAEYDGMAIEPWQRFAAVPQVSNFDGRTGEWPNEWLDAVLADDRFAVIMPFDWVGSPEGPGLRDAPAELRQAWIDAGHEIVNAREEP